MNYSLFYRSINRLREIEVACCKSDASLSDTTESQNLSQCHTGNRGNYQVDFLPVCEKCARSKSFLELLFENSLTKQRSFSKL